MKILIIISLVHLAWGNEAAPEEAQEDDPKEQYFRYVRVHSADSSKALAQGFNSSNIPKPGGFNFQRVKRDEDEVIEKIAEEELGKPLELEELEAENSTEVNYDLEPKNDVVINDFIRFKRELEEMAEKEDKSNVAEDVDNVRPKREHERSGKMLMDNGQAVGSGNRDPRGATKEQWIKQPYPVQTTNPNRNYDDNVPSPSDTARAPRVHFVTQKRSESAPPLVYHSYDRESRSRDLNRQQHRESDWSKDRGDYSRTPKYYNNPQPNYPYRPEPHYPRDDKRQEYNFSGRYEKEPLPAYTKQKRIIYYATLPEIVRSPPNVDLRDRYNHPYDNRYVTSPPLSVENGENYRYRNNPNQFSKSRYDEAGKSGYLGKVSSPDVNVREVKKNPERRIYFEADRRYGHKPNYNEEYDRNM